MGCGSGTNTVVQQSSPPAPVLAAYQGLVNQGTAVAQTPLSQYQGPVIAGFNPTQQAAFAETNQAQGSALPYINAAQNYLAAGATPAMSQVQGFNTLNEFQNPYTSTVTQALQNLYANQNAQQFNAATAQGNALGNGFGGDRTAVLDAQLAQQQNLAEAPTLANVLSTGFTGAEQELNAQQNLQLQGAEGTGWLAENAAGLESGLGAAAMNSLLSGASAELQTGALQQQLQQEELAVPAAQFQTAQAFPYAATNFLAGITEGAGSGMGGTSSTTGPGPSVLGQVAGLGITGLGAYGLYNNLSAGPSSAIPAGMDTAFSAPQGAFTIAPAAAATDAALGYSALTDAPLVGAGMSLFAGAKRGGRIGFPSIHRDNGGFIPGLSANDADDVRRAIQLASAMPVPQGGSGSRASLNIKAPSPSQLPQGVDFGSLLRDIGVANQAVKSLPQQQCRGGSTGFPSFSTGGFPRGFADASPSGNVGDNEDSGFPSTFNQPASSGQDGLSRAFSSPWMSLIAAGAGMMASKSPYPGVALGEGIQSGLRYAAGQKEAQLQAKRANAPYVDISGATMKIVYPDGRIIPTSLGTGQAGQGQPSSPVSPAS
ncbi:MAG TPA: hypothetical protein VEI03_19990 [Stellaceae bacterium]|nr:hypothetical protein [Stellaceae bacterium]